MKKFTIEKLKEIAAVSRRKPTQYHHVCHAGSYVINWLDEWTDSDTYECDRGPIAGTPWKPACGERSCGYIHKVKEKSMPKSYGYVNEGIDLLYDAILSFLSEDETEVDMPKI